MTPPKIDRFIGEYYWLSNFYASPIIMDNHLYPTVEHAFQAGKSDDPDYRYKMAYRTQTPNEAKKLGQMITLRSDWEDFKIDYMRLLVNKKFKIPALRKLLIATGDAKLVEGNTWGDDFWGVYAGKGKNHLGIILMDVREDIINQRGKLLRKGR